MLKEARALLRGYPRWRSWRNRCGAHGHRQRGSDPGTGGLATPLVVGPMAAALAGLGAGALGGGIVGGLVGVGIGEKRAKDYEKGLRDGGILVAVRPKSKEHRADVRKALEHDRSTSYGESTVRSTTPARFAPNDPKTTPTWSRERGSAKPVPFLRLKGSWEGQNICKGRVFMAGILWAVISVLFVLWLLGFLLHFGGGLIHLILVIVVVLVVVNLLTGRGARV